MHEWHSNRWIGLFLCVLSCVGTASLSSPVNARELGAMTLHVHEATGDRPQVLVLTGRWPDSCVPRFLRASRDGAELTVQLQAPDHDCAEQSTPFQIPVETRTAFAASTPESRIYRVRITLSRGEGAAELIGFRLLDLGAAAVQPESGFWWSRSRPGDTAAPLAGGGIGLEVQGDQLAVSLLAFAANGTPTWYFGSAQRIGRTAQVPLIQLFNGGGSDDLNGKQTGVQAGPLLALEFVGPTAARGWLLGPTGAEADAPLNLQALLLRRAIFDGRATGSSWLGSWVFVLGRTSHVIDLTRLVNEDDDSFRLFIGSADFGAATLECRYRGNGSSAEIDGCSMVQAGRVLASFGQVGIDRLSGTSDDGRNAQLLRIVP
ncbi:MAG: hypothetical protein WBP11_05325 [Dokdonella sp.]